METSELLQLLSNHVVPFTQVRDGEALLKQDIRLYEVKESVEKLLAALLAQEKRKALEHAEVGLLVLR
jgi:hypothetical protein